MAEAFSQSDLRADVRYLVVCVIFLSGFGSIMIFSAAAAFDTNYFERHLLFLALGSAGAVFILLCPLSFLSRSYRLFLALAFILVIATAIFGREVNGAQRWLRLGWFSFQIAEWSKFFLMIYLCGYLSKYQEELGKDHKRFLVPLVFILILAMLLILQPDLGSAVVILSAVLCLMFVVGIKLRFFFGAFVFFLLGLVLLIFSEPYRLQRVTAFFDPWSDQYNSGYQLTQALIAFGRGEWFGLGLGGSIQKLFYLPEAHNDFILAVIAEELGIVGAIFLIFFLAIFVFKIFQVAQKCVGEGLIFPGLSCYFIACIFSIQTLINVAVSTGMLPTKGLTLPFISYGGNSIVVSLLFVGIVMRSLKELAQKYEI